MEFGHLQDISGIDFTLLPDSASTIQILQANKTNDPLRVYVGAPKWGEKNWKGVIYPKKALDKEFLNLYCQSFNTVEFGATFYNLFPADVISKWVAQTAEAPDFKFSPKFPQSITHIRRLVNADEQTAQFYQSLTGLGNKLGPILMQLGDNFTPKSFKALETYLGALVPTYKVHVEVRSKHWFADPATLKAFFGMLARFNIGTVISDTAGRRDCAHMELTTPDAYIRFVGNNLDDSDFRRLDDWVERIATWHELGLKSLWFFIHENNERYVPDASKYFIEKLNAKLGLAIKSPVFIKEDQ